MKCDHYAGYGSDGILDDCLVFSSEMEDNGRNAELDIGFAYCPKCGKKIGWGATHVK